MRARSFGRNRRVADLVQRELAAMLQRELTDPNAGMVTVSAVDISPDLKNARIYITSMGGDQRSDALVRDLNNAAGHYRHALARILTMRTVPHLKFEYDVSLERARHLTDLIDSVSAPASAAPDADDVSST